MPGWEDVTPLWHCFQMSCNKTTHQLSQHIWLLSFRPSSTGAADPSRGAGTEWGGCGCQCWVGLSALPDPVSDPGPCTEFARPLERGWWGLHLLSLFQSAGGFGLTQLSHFSNGRVATLH